MKRIVYALFLVVAILPLGLPRNDLGSAWAQSAFSGLQNDGGPLEIIADDGMEWDRSNQTLTARGNAVASQGGQTVRAQTLIAQYRQSETGDTVIERLNASGGVVLEDEQLTVTGESAVFEVESEILTVTGAPRLESATDVIVAEERLVYWARERRAEAVGRAVLDRGVNRLTGDIIRFWFMDSSGPSSGPSASEGGSMRLDRLEAEGNVVVVSPDETATGAKLVYNARTEQADLTGNVTLTRGEDIITGPRAVIDLARGVGRVLGTGESGRVRALFQVPAGQE